VNSGDTIGDLGEHRVIRRLASLLPFRPELIQGVGDDTAVVRGNSGSDLLLTSDAVVEDVHFLPETEGRLVGRKAIARVLSDIAAMGGEPGWALIDVAAPLDTEMTRLEEMYRGAVDISNTYGLTLVGGDTARAAMLQLHVFAIGRVPEGTAVLRSGAHPGDAIYVTGALGGSISGSHLTFEPRMEVGDWLREGGWAKAMIDVSDGLATDLRHVIEQSRVGAVVETALVPVSDDAQTDPSRSAIEHALFDGEDFELLFTVDASRSRAFEHAWGERFDVVCTRVGTTTGEVGSLRCRDADGSERELLEQGYEHFSSS